MTTTPAVLVDQDDDLDISISAIEHYSYCPRQCALIHVEATWTENVFTIRGKLAHERVDSGEDAPAHGVKVLRGIPLWSDRLGLRGRADAVEMRAAGPYPVEYKVGRRRGQHADLQLCAQALCLEEMLDVAVPRGAIYHAATRSREEIAFTAALRQHTLDIIAAIRTILQNQTLPEAPNDARCRRCSLITACLPSVVADKARLRGLQGALYQTWDTPSQGEG